jgi:hypothetical protein
LSQKGGPARERNALAPAAVGDAGDVLNDLDEDGLLIDVEAPHQHQEAVDSLRRGSRCTMNAIEGQLSKTCWTEMVPFSVVVAQSAHLPSICLRTSSKMPVSPAFLQ